MKASHLGGGFIVSTSLIFPSPVTHLCAVFHKSLILKFWEATTKSSDSSLYHFGSVLTALANNSKGDIPHLGLGFYGFWGEH